MMDENTQISAETNLKTVLEHFLTSKNCIRNDCYLEKLFTHLKTADDSTLALGVPWLKALLTEGHKPHASILAFGIKFANISCQKNPALLQDILDSGTADLLLALPHTSASVELAAFALMRQLITTNPGLVWFSTKKGWNSLISYENQSYTIFTLREAANFLHDFLKELQDVPDFCREVVTDLLRPLSENIWMKPNMEIFIDNWEAKGVVLKMLKLLELIFVRVLDQPDTYIPYYLFATKLQDHLWKLLDFALDHDFHRQLIRVTALANCVHFLCLKVPPETTLETLSYKQFTINFYNIVQFAIHRKNVDLALECTEVTNRTLQTRKYTEEPIDGLYFCDQLFFLMLLPAFFILLEKNTNAECFGVFDKTSEQTVRLLYGMRDVLNETQKDKTDVSVKSIQTVALSSTRFTRERALLMFDKFQRTLLRFVCPTSEGMAMLEYDNPRFLLVILMALNALIEQYGFSMVNAKLEPDLIKATIWLLNVPGLEMKVMVEAIKFARLVIKNFHSNGLGLSTVNGSNLEALMPTIFKRLHDIEWEVRDSTLEFLSFIVELSNTRYEGLQPEILENNLCSTVVTIARNDNECFVRSSALKCLREMIRINKLWTAFASVDLTAILSSLLANESEGIVRREAVDTLIAIYIHKSACPEEIRTTMIHCAAMDLHWEVRVNALKFWKHTLERVLSQQGMTDGCFPQQIFSSELRKIVTLNEREIHARIGRALTEFKDLGGFGVLLANLEDTADFEVIRVTVEIIKDLQNSLERYGFEPPEDGDDVSEMEEPQGELIHENGNQSEAVLENIVNTDDIRLLANTRNLNNLVIEERYDDSICRKFVSVSVSNFFRKVSAMELDSLLYDRQEWIANTESFESLLEDVISSFRGSEINGMDCY